MLSNINLTVVDIEINMEEVPPTYLLKSISSINSAQVAVIFKLLNG